MRKITVLFLVALLSVMLLAIPSNAAPDPMAVAFQEQLGLLDWYYNYNFEYMISEVTSRLLPDDFWERELPYVTSPASEFEALLHDLFVLSNEDIEDLRTYGNTYYSRDYYDSYEDIHVKYDFYDASTKKYAKASGLKITASQDVVEALKEILWRWRSPCAQIRRIY